MMHVEPSFVLYALCLDLRLLPKRSYSTQVELLNLTKKKSCWLGFWLWNSNTPRGRKAIIYGHMHHEPHK